MANPMSQSAAPPVSRATYTIAGIKCTVYGLTELPSSIPELAVLWLLHPRLQTQESMAPVANACIGAWNRHLETRNPQAEKSKKGLIAVSFDQRNHGSRMVDAVANEAWRQGNERHAVDMFSAYQGTAFDTLSLLPHLASYLPPKTPSITSHMVLGVSLGGHAAWLCALHSPLISAACIVVGCADYTRLMQQRAEKSKRPSWKTSNPAGSAFLGSVDFPPALMEEVGRWDPAGLLLPEELKARNAAGSPSPTSTHPTAVATAPAAAAHPDTYPNLSPLRNKSLLLLSGAVDKLVPYACSQPFLSYLKSSISPGGMYADAGITLEDLLFEGVGHQFSPAMEREAVRWVCEVLAGDSGSKGETGAHRKGEGRVRSARL